MKFDVKRFRCGDVEIAASCKTKMLQPSNFYLPHFFLVYVNEGYFHLKVDDHEYKMSPGSYAIMNKFTEGAFWKTSPDSGNYGKVYGFALASSFMAKAIGDIDTNATPNIEPVVEIKADGDIENVMLSIASRIDKDVELDEHYVLDQTEKILRSIHELNPGIIAGMQKYTEKATLNLEKLMNNSFLISYTLEDYAKMSGKSLSTFNRSFRQLFNETPHRWIMKKRLYHAKKLIEEKGLRPSEVYSLCGFEDLAHFSRSFKKKFAITPSAYFRSISE